MEKFIPEIYQNSDSNQNVWDFMAQRANEENPYYNDTDYVRTRCSEQVRLIIKSLKSLFVFSFQKNKEKVEYYRREIVHLIVGMWDISSIWVRKASVSDNKELYIQSYRILDEISEHAKQFDTQLKTIIESILKWNNTINSFNQAKHLEEILNELTKSINELLTLHDKLNKTKMKKLKEIVTEAVLSFLNEENGKTLDSLNIPSNMEDAEEEVGDIGFHDEFELNETRRIWFEKLAERINYNSI